MIEYTVEPAALQDVDRLYEIECACFSKPWSKDALSDLISNRSKYLCLAAYASELQSRTIFGYVGFLFVLDEGEITNIAVHPDYEGLGIGYSLMEAVKNDCREQGIGRIHLEVRPGNVPALAVYRKCGFEQTGRRRGYYADTGEDALLFTWKDL